MNGPDETGCMERIESAVFFALCFAALLILPSLASGADGRAAGTKRAVTVADCVSVRRVVPEEAKLSPDDTKIAYIVKAPDVTTDENQYQIWIRNLSDLGQRENGKMIFRTDVELSRLAWLQASKKEEVVVLENQDKVGSKVLLIDAESGKTDTLADVPDKIAELTAASSGEAIAYSAPVKDTADKQHELSAAEIARGYYVPFQYPGKVRARRLGTKRSIWILRRGAGGSWRESAIRQSDGKTVAAFESVSGLRLSPDGKWLAFLYQGDQVSQDWLANPRVHALKESLGSNPTVLDLYDMTMMKLSQPAGFLQVSQNLKWSEDSTALAVVASPPVNSSWEQQDLDAKRDPANTSHLFTFDPKASSVSEVLRLADSQIVNLVGWPKADGPMVINRKPLTWVDEFAEPGTALSWISRTGQKWEESQKVNLPMEGDLDSLALYGDTLVGVAQTPTVAPDIFLHNLATRTTSVLTDLNLSVHNLTLGSVEKVEWTNRYGGRIQGNLVRPTNYEPGKKYPLVILLTWPEERFICDGHYATAFPPEPLANAGFAVLIFNVYDVDTPGAAQPDQPLREAKTMVASVESAVNSMVERGIVDRANVGIIGFSRTSWKVDYLLTHSDFKFRAASSADSGIYNYGVYWLTDGDAYDDDEYEANYGGPPYGATLKAWLQGAPAFNAEKVQSPVLMEFTGDGYDPADQPSKFAYEFHTALERMGKPVELFYYPNGSHPLDTPFDRVASLQRNVDSFRFWMQGYEGKAPEYDPDQYVRWEKLRDQQKWNEMVIAKGGDPATEYLRQTGPAAAPANLPPAPAAKP